MPGTEDKSCQQGRIEQQVGTTYLQVGQSVLEFQDQGSDYFKYVLEETQEESWCLLYPCEQDYVQDYKKSSLISEK